MNAIESSLPPAARMPNNGERRAKVGHCHINEFVVIFGLILIHFFIFLNRIEYSGKAENNYNFVASKF